MKLHSSFSLTLLAICASALLCAPALAGTIILDYGANNDVPHSPYTEVIQAGDSTPVAVIGERPDVQDPFNIGPIALTDGATISWTNVTAWNNNSGSGNAGENYFAGKTANATSYSITTANPNDVVTVEGVGGFSRTGIIDYDGAAAVTLPQYTVGTSGWTLIGTSTGSATGTLLPDSDPAEGNLGAMRITITPAVVPEPSSLALLGLAGFSLLAVRRRK